MKATIEILPCDARCTAILLQHRENKNSKDYTYTCIWSTIELLKRDMQDYAMPLKTMIDSLNHWTNNDRILYVQERFVLTDEYLEKFPNTMLIDNTEINNEEIDYISEPKNGSIIVNPYKTERVNFIDVLPVRNSVGYLKTWIDKNRLVEAYIKQSDALQKQISALSKKNLGFDLLMTNKHLGNIYLLRYNPVFRSVDCRCSIEPVGLFIKINYRKGQRGKLRLRVSDFHQSGMAVYEKDVNLDYIPRGYTFVELPEEPHRLTIKLFDKRGDLVYYQHDIVFVKSFNLDVKMQTKTIRLNIKDKKGKERNKDIHKFVSMDKKKEKKNFVPEEFFTQPDRKVVDGDFYFFDGNKEHKAENVNAAKNVVSEILDKAKKECYICDPYFSAEDFFEFVFPVKDIDVPVRIISSKEFMGKQYDEEGNVKSDDAIKEGNRLYGVIQKYNEICGDGKTNCRVLIGKSVLHDRFIIVDNNVWCIGSSFSEIGARATTIYRVPDEYCKQIKSQVEKWWVDGDNSMALKDYVECN